VTLTKLSIGIILVVVIAVAFAGCTSTSPTTPTTSGAPSGGTSAPTSASGTSASGSVVTGSSIFGSAQPYNWVEYKTVTITEGKQMTMYFKYDKKGTCSMRIEGEGMPSGGMTMDCSSSGGKTTQSNPNDVKSDVQFTFVGIEPVSVPAGTYATASKYTVTTQGQTMTYWTAPGVPTFVKYQMNTPQGVVTTELNGWG
jgi:hypothetical protein